MLRNSSAVDWCLDTMSNEFYAQFGAWPETHLVLASDGELRLRTESELGEGTLKGGEWDALVECEILALLSSA